MKIELKIEVEAAEAARVLLLLKTADNKQLVDWLVEVLPKPKKEGE